MRLIPDLPLREYRHTPAPRDAGAANLRTPPEPVRGLTRPTIRARGFAATWRSPARAAERFRGSCTEGVGVERKSMVRGRKR